MKPFVYVITDSYDRETLKPTLESVVAHLKKTGCPAHMALRDKPVMAHYDDDHEPDYVDLSPFTEPCEPSPEKVAELSKSLDAAIESSEKRWAERQAKLKPGQKHVGFSGERWIFKSDRDQLLNAELEKWRVRWKA